MQIWYESHIGRKSVLEYPHRNLPSLLVTACAMQRQRRLSAGYSLDRAMIGWRETGSGGRGIYRCAEKADWIGACLAAEDAHGSEDRKVWSTTTKENHKTAQV